MQGLPDNLDDQHLLVRWREGDKAAGEALIDRYSDAVFRFFSTKVSTNPDDLIQRTFLALMEGLDRFEYRSSLRTYLFGIAKRVLYAHYRELKRNPALDFTQSTLQDAGTSPSSDVARKEAGLQLHDALRLLPAEQQIALELHYWEAMTPKDIAAVLEVPESTIYSRLRRARERLAELLDTAGETVGPQAIERQFSLHPAAPLGG